MSRTTLPAQVMHRQTSQDAGHHMQMQARSHGQPETYISERLYSEDLRTRVRTTIVRSGEIRSAGKLEALKQHTVCSKEQRRRFLAVLWVRALQALGSWNWLFFTQPRAHLASKPSQGINDVRGYCM